MQTLMQTATTRGCPLCGGHEIERDEVLAGGVLLIAWCMRCWHRWTSPSLVLAPSVGPERAEPGVAVAA